MGDFEHEYRLPVCPECGKIEGAILNSSSWGHDISCCSSKCGLEIQKKLRENSESKEFKEALSELILSMEKFFTFKYKGMKSIGFKDRNLLDSIRYGFKQ